MDMEQLGALLKMCSPFYLKGMEHGSSLGVIASLYLFFYFQVKHLVVDFFVQGRFPWMWQNKHKLFHLGGWAHAATHAVASFAVLWCASDYTDRWLSLAGSLCLIELFAHFLIDYTKMNIGRWRNWGPTNSPYFWDLLGVDQYLHQLTYLFMVGVWLA